MELHIHLEDLVSTRTVRDELHKSIIHSAASIAKPLITESNAQMRRRRYHDRKTRTLDKWKRAHNMVR
jgi:hypothetical protein